MVGSGYVLAGGSSRRLGRDKALLEVGGMTLVERAVRTLEALGLEVRVVCGSEDQARRVQSPAILDRTPGQGPVMGIWSALHHSDHQNNCFLCCDMPFLPSKLLSKLWSRKRGFHVVVPTDQKGRIQPLCGIYSKHCLGVLEDQLERGVLSILDVLKSERLKVKVVAAQELDVNSHTFLNINDRASLRALEEHLGKTTQPNRTGGKPCIS